MILALMALMALVFLSLPQEMKTRFSRAENAHAWGKVKNQCHQCHQCQCTPPKPPENQAAIPAPMVAAGNEED